jgi:hypothetical protein
VLLRTSYLSSPYRCTSVRYALYPLFECMLRVVSFTVLQHKGRFSVLCVVNVGGAVLCSSTFSFVAESFCITQYPAAAQLHLNTPYCIRNYVKLEIVYLAFVCTTAFCSAFLWIELRVLCSSRVYSST